MRPSSTLTPCAGEPALSDPAVTGEFASEMASIAHMEHIVPWCSYILRREGRPVGFGGFKGDPDPQGTVEIGYLTFPDHVGQGVASELAGGLLGIAREAGARRVLAHTLPQANASTRVLEKNGFAHIGSAMDEDVGEAWQWERVL